MDSFDDFDDMTLTELAEIAYAVLADQLELTRPEISEFQKVFSSRIEQCERLESMSGTDGKQPPQVA